MEMSTLKTWADKVNLVKNNFYIWWKWRYDYPQSTVKNWLTDLPVTESYGGWIGPEVKNFETGSCPNQKVFEWWIPKLINKSKSLLEFILS